MARKMKQKACAHSVRVALMLLAGVSAAGVYAQEASSDDGKVERVVITGSNIKSVQAETASPVQVIKKEDIQRQGVTNVADLINNLAASTPNGALSDINGSNSFASGGSNVTLRNMGEQSTLILLNGRRLPSYALADFTAVFTNVDAIPIDAVERVEVLKTGASAIYGSDAVAGVINIITKQNYQGIDVSADRTQSEHGDIFGTSKASITAGFGDLDKDGYNVLMNADYYKRQNVMWTGLLQYTNPALLKYSPSFGSYSSYSYPGNIIDGPNSQPVAGCPANLIIGGLCKYNRYAQFQAVPNSERASFYSTGTLNLGGGTQAFGEVLYSKISTGYIDAKPYYGDSLNPVYWANPRTGQSLVFNYLGLLASSPLNPTGDDGVGFRYRFADAPAYQNVKSDEYRVLGGLRGTVKGFDWETAVGFMGSKTDTYQQGSFSSSGFIQTIGDYRNIAANTNPYVSLSYNTTDPNFFNQPGGYRPGQANSAAVLNTLFPVFGQSGKNSQAFADGKITGDLFALPAGNVGFAFGGEIRHESYTITPSANLLAGDIVGLGISSSDASRNTMALYTEFSIPVVKNFELSAAARMDKYPDLSAHFSPRLAFRYTPNDSILFRGTIENGFRAPNLIESATSLKTSFSPGTTDPLRCQQATALSNDLNAKAAALSPSDPQVALLLAMAESVYSNECSFGLATKTTNNPSLQPETSRSISVGMVIEPIKGYSASLDYWHIDRKNTIGLPATSQVLNGGPLPAGVAINRATLNPAADPTFSAAEIAQYGVTSGPLTGLSNMMENLTEQITSGVDAGFKIRQKISNFGTLNISGDGTYLISYKDSSISDITENLAGQYGYSHFNGNLTVGIDHGPVSTGLRWNYNRGYSLHLGASDQTWNPATCAENKVTACYVAPSQTVDYFFSYTGIKNAVIGLNVINIFNQQAAADLRAFTVGGIIPTSLQDAQGRMVRLSLNYKFK